MILDEPNASIYKSSADHSELLKKLGQYAPHLAVLLEGPQIDPHPSPLSTKTTDDFIQLLEFGWLPSEVAVMWGVDRAELSLWIDSDNRRSSRAKLARKSQAEMWDRVAFAIGLHAPSDKVEMVRAKLLMDHCKWRSSTYNPDDYAKRLTVKNVASDTDARELTTAELQIIARGGVLPGGL